MANINLPVGASAVTYNYVVKCGVYPSGEGRESTERAVGSRGRGESARERDATIARRETTTEIVWLVGQHAGGVSRDGARR